MSGQSLQSRLTGPFAAPLYDSRGESVRLGKKLGSGGEGAVYEIASDARFVAKIYHRPASVELAEKLRSMTSLAAAESSRFAALPVATLSQIRNGPLIGLVMPRVRNHLEIHTLYSPAHRKTHYPDKDWAFLVHVAMNVAAVFDSLHQRSIVIGDVNQGNVLVSSQGTVCLIDCDSFQLEANERVYPCEVGVAHFTPPELQGRSFHGIQRTANHDLFGLAVLIFHLLCMGRHPYAGRFTGKGEPLPLEKAIEQFRYAYSQSSKKWQIEPPPQTLLLPAVMPRLAGLFERAFTQGSEQPNARPTETEWYDALREFKSQLKPCSADIGHKYPNYLGQCPWCSLERDGAPNLFASVTAHLVGRREGELKAGAEHLWRPLLELEREIKGCTLEKITFDKFIVQSTPIPPEIEQNQTFSRVIGAIAATSLLITAFSGSLPLLMYSTSIFAIGFGIWWFVLNRVYGIGPELARRRNRVQQAISKLRQVEHQGNQELDSIRQEFQTAFRRLDYAKVEIESLQGRYTADLDALNMQRERRQLDEFLQEHVIRESAIPLIGDSQIAALESFGIETAYDLNEVRLLNIGGFSSGYMSALMDWKKGILRNFKFRPREQISNVDRNTILARYLRRREELEDTLTAGRESLELIINQQHELKSRHQQRLELAGLEVRQAEADLKVTSI